MFENRHGIFAFLVELSIHIEGFSTVEIHLLLSAAEPSQDKVTGSIKKSFVLTEVCLSTSGAQCPFQGHFPDKSDHAGEH